MHSPWKDPQRNLNMEQLQNILKGTNYQIVQSNGQRIYSPSTSAGISVPPRGTEIFIGNLPHDLYEDELIPIFSRKGPIYNVRLMLDFFGSNRGYAFICYFREQDAHAAVATFNNYRIRNQTRIAVYMSVDNRRLFIGNIPRDRTLEEIRFVLEKYVEGIADVILYNEPFNQRLNRGFVFVEFQNHRLAAIARRRLAPGNLVIWGKTIFVDWAEPLPSVSPEILKHVTKLYLSNIPIAVTSDQLKGILYNLLGTTHILKVHKIKDFAFIHFTIRKRAEEAFQRLQGLVIMGNVIRIDWARPIEYSKSRRLGQLPENCCRSVPPCMRKLVLQSIASRKISIPNHYDSSESSGSTYVSGFRKPTNTGPVDF